ncbi:MAG: DUF1467 family protein [Pseudomonadota bacterium]
MTITGAMVLFAVIWFMGLLIALPLNLRTQGDEGEVEPGTHASSPTNPDVKRKMRWVTLITFVLWVPLCALIMSGIVTMRDIDFFGRMGPG